MQPQGYATPFCTPLIFQYIELLWVHIGFLIEAQPKNGTQAWRDVNGNWDKKVLINGYTTTHGYATPYYQPPFGTPLMFLQIDHTKVTVCIAQEKDHKQN